MKTPKWTAAKVTALKGSAKVVCLTAYDYTTARLVDEAGVQLVLVGDSLAMTVLGHPTTLPATMAVMLHHTAAVVRGVTRAMVIADMPFMSYQTSGDQALANAGRFVQKAGADGVKLEGGRLRVETIRRLVENGIPVLGHIGLTPQSVRATGGFRVQGRSAEDAQRLRDDAQSLVEAGVFAIVLECMPPELGATITREVAVPTIGIGAGPGCDGQILVVHDVLGLSPAAPKFAKQYADLGARMAEAFREYKADVESGRFPGPEHSY